MASYNIADAVTADKIVQSYKSGNFLVRKYQSGMIEYFHTVSKTCNDWAAWGSLYATSGDGVEKFPTPIKTIYLWECTIASLTAGWLMPSIGGFLKNSNDYFYQTASLSGVLPKNDTAVKGSTIIRSQHIVGMP